jgi:hypothetical protein
MGHYLNFVISAINGFFVSKNIFIRINVVKEMDYSLTVKNVASKSLWSGRKIIQRK